MATIFKLLFSKKYWNSVFLLTEAAIVRQNKNSFLGSLWGLVQPCVHIIIISYFFGFLLKQPGETMVINLVGGLPLWNFLVTSLNISANSLVSRDNIIKKVIISKTLFPIADTMVQVYTLAYSFVAMYGAFSLIYPAKFSIMIIFAPLLSLPLIICVLCISISVAFLTPYVRDIPQILNVLLSVIYWSIPIIYPYSMVPESKKIFFELNPVFILIRPVQYLVAEGRFPDSLLILKSALVSLLCVIVSYMIYRRLARNVIYYL